MVVQEEEATLAQVERILNSNTLRNAEVLRRLFKFLAQKSVSGEAGELKEYTVGIDALGKPSTYDPRQDSVVRIQIGRLRHKLADYYRAEGKDDPIIIDLPKGHFKLTWETRAEAPVAAPVIESAAPVLIPAAPVDAPRQVWPRSAILVVAVVAVWAAAATGSWIREHRATASFRETWTPELQELWKPFLASSRPLVVAVSAPLFVGFPGYGFYRDLSLNTWEEVLASPKIQAIRKTLGNPPLVARYYYTGGAEMTAALQLGKLLNFSNLRLSTARSNEISWQQMADNNVLFIGAPRTFGEQMHKLPTALDFSLEEDGVHDLRSGGGKTAIYADNYPSISSTGAASILDNGEIYALISRTPGPLGSGAVQNFSSNHSPGVLGAVQWFTVPAMAKQLVDKLRKPSGELPTYFQLVLKVKYRDAVPTDVSYVTYRELHPDRRAGE